MKYDFVIQDQLLQDILSSAQ